MANVPTKRTTQIDSKYSVANNTFSRVIKDSPERKIETEVGDSKQPDFKPQVKTSWFDNEYNRSIRAEEHPGASVRMEGEKIIYERPDGINIVQYDNPEAGQDGGHVFEWELTRKPNTNILKFSLLYKGSVSFHYQPPLTAEEESRGVRRTENVVGSYAVYIDKAWHYPGRPNYANGKIEHIYRPKATDAVGQETWCDLFIPQVSQPDVPVEGTVSVPQDFLDSAIYPVKVK